MSQTRLAIRSVLFNFGNLVCSIALAFVVPPILRSRLGAEQFGLWQVLMDVVGYYSLSDLGVGRATTKYLSQYSGPADRTTYLSILSNSLIANQRLAAGTFVVVIVVSFIFPLFFPLQSESDFYLRIVVFFSGFKVCVGLLGHAYESVPRSLGRLDVVSTIQAGTNLAGSLAMLIALWNGGGLLALVLIQLLIEVIKRSIQISIVRRFVEIPSEGLPPLAPDIIKKLFSFGFLAILIQLAQRAGSLSGAPLIGLKYGLEESGNFGIAQGLSTRCREFSRSISDVVMPAAARLDVRADAKVLLRVAVVSSRILAAICLVFVVDVFILGRTFLQNWYHNDDVTQATYPLACVLILATFIRLPAVGVCQTLEGMGVMALLSRLSVFEAVLTLACQATLLFPFGPIGVAWGVLIAQVVCNGICLPIFAAKILDLSPLKLVANIYFVPLLTTIPGIALAVWFDRYFPAPNMLTIAAQFSAVGIVIAGATFFICLDAEGRAAAWKTLADVWRKILKKGKAAPQKPEDRSK